VPAAPIETSEKSNSIDVSNFFICPPWVPSNSIILGWSKCDASDEFSDGLQIFIKELHPNHNSYQTARPESARSLQSSLSPRLKDSIENGSATDQTNQIHRLTGTSGNMSAAYQAIRIRTRVHLLA